MHFRGVWPGNSVCVKLPRLESGSAPVPGFGVKQVVGIQQHLSIELSVFLWGRLLCSCTPGAVCLCFYGEWVQVLSRSCETQQCCSIGRALTDTGLSFLCCFGVSRLCKEGGSNIAGIQDFFILLVLHFRIM